MEKTQQPAALTADGATRRRLRGLALRFGIFLVVMAMVAMVDVLMFPDRVFAVFPAVLWGAPLSLHVAWVMGLFDIFRKAG